jgi:hypothetical protein
MTGADSIEHAAGKSARFRWGRWLCLLTLVVLLLLGGLAATYYALWRAADRELEAVLAELDERDPGWRLEEIQARRLRLPDEQNSAVRVTAVRKLIADGWLPKDSTPGGNGKRPRLPLDKRVSQVPPNVQLDKELTAELRAELAKVAQARNLARSLVNMPRGRYPLAWGEDADPDLSPCKDARLVERLLLLDAALLAQECKADEAASSVRALLNAGRSIGDEPNTLAQLIRADSHPLTAAALERTLGQGEVAEGGLKGLQELLEQEVDEPLFLYAARGERASGYQRRLWIEAGNGGENSLKWRMVARRMHLPELRLLTQYVELARLPYEQHPARLAQLQALHDDEALPFLTRMHVPSFSITARTFALEQARLRAAVLALAAERHRRQHGRWPGAADALVQAGLLHAVPTDPYGGAPLRYRSLPDGVVVYSIGPNRTGDVDTLSRWDSNRKGTDLGFRLWDVTRRRQPPAPAPKNKEP